jgi:glucose-6-phosphate 1-epimerase
MKLSFTTVALLAASVSAFSPSKPTTFVAKSSSSTSLNASKNKQKIVSRTKWAETRGISDGVATATSSASDILTNDEGLEYIRLKHGDSTADVYLYGGVVTSYIKEGVEYIAVRPDAKMDGSKPISGGLSHCFPQFGTFLWMLKNDLLYRPLVSNFLLHLQDLERFNSMGSLVTSSGT